MSASHLCQRLASSGGNLKFSAARISSSLSTRVVTMAAAVVRNSPDSIDSSAITASRHKLVANRVYSCKAHSV